MSFFVQIIRDGEKIQPSDLDKIVQKFPYIHLVTGIDVDGVENNHEGECEASDQVPGIYLKVDRLGGATAYLFYNEAEGVLETNLPERDVMGAMIEIAAFIGGRVRDELFHTYLSIDDVFVHAGDIEYARKNADIVRHMLRRDKRRRYLLNILLICGSLIFVFGSKMPILGLPLATEIDSKFRYTSHRQVNLTANIPHNVLVVATEDFNGDYASYLADKTGDYLGLEIKYGGVLKIRDLKPYKKDQYDVRQVITLAKQQLQLKGSDVGANDASKFATIILTNKDINDPDGGHNFRFHTALNDPPVAVISTSHLLYGDFIFRASDETLEDRLFKYMLRSLGMVYYRAAFTTNPTNIMYVPIKTVDDIDKIIIPPKNDSK